MKAVKNKHLSFEDRCVIQEFLNFRHNFTQIGNRVGRHRTTIAQEVLHHRYLRNDSKTICELTDKPPYVCNGCKEKPCCRKQKYFYEASIANNEYKKTLTECRSSVNVTKDQVAAINDVLTPLMVEKHHSVNQIYIEHPELVPFSKSTFYRYIDMGLLNIRNIDLVRKVHYRVKKEYEHKDYKLNISMKINRFYKDFKDYLEMNPNCSIVEMDTVIGTQGGKGGKCFLTLLFRKFNFMLIYLLPYKQSKYVLAVFDELKKSLGADEFKRLFEVILTDNGTEFSDPESIEIDCNTGEKLSSVFFCEPNSSWQKGSIERNHQYIRYVLPKGTSFAGLTQEDCYLLASHINAVPRESLNRHSPYDIALPIIGQKNMDKFNISHVAYDDINLSIRLLRK